MPKRFNYGLIRRCIYLVPGTWYLVQSQAKEHKMTELTEIDGFFYAKNHKLLCLKTKLSKNKIHLKEGVTYIASSVAEVKGSLVLIPMDIYTSDSNAHSKSVNRLIELDRYIIGSIKNADESLQRILGFK